MRDRKRMRKARKGRRRKEKQKKNKPKYLNILRPTWKVTPKAWNFQRAINI
jgi:hypothetical protein